MKTPLILLSTLLGMASLFAGPVRPVISSQFSQQAPAANGPPPDPNALRGQWFVNPANTLESASKWELHDNDDPLCIRGSVVAIQWGIGMTGGMTNIAGFTIQATVINNLSPATLPAGSATNSHQEVQIPPQPLYQGTMHRTRIAAEFAVAEAGPTAPPLVGIAPNPPGMTPPYYYDPRSQRQYVIESQNENLAAWYCYLGGDPQNPNNPPGAYYVPAWEMGDIPPGGSNQVMMNFVIRAYGGGPAEMPSTDIRHAVLRHSLMNGSDVLYGRSESLKISHWLDLILVDYVSWIGTAPGEENDPVEYIYASDVSVFFDSASATNRPVLKLTPLFTNQTLSALQLDWLAQDIGPYWLQYCDDLVSNNWVTVQLPALVPPVVPPPVIPGPMQWTDNGTVLMPALRSPRYYRLLIP